MTKTAEICNEFSTFLLALEVGPWKDDGSGTIIESLFERDSASESFSLSTLSNLQEMDVTKQVAQLKANEIGCKVVLSLSGNHKQVGMNRIELGVFHPQIKTEFRTPISVHLEVKVPNGRIDVKGDNLDLAKENLTNCVHNNATTSYGWGDRRMTRRLIPEPPEDHSLLVILVEPRRDRLWEVSEEYFVAVRNSKWPIFKDDTTSSGEFFTLKNGGVADVKIPTGSYIHDGDCWTVVNPQCWWTLSS